jgi:hypothetical protein
MNLRSRLLAGFQRQGRGSTQRSDVAGGLLWNWRPFCPNGLAASVAVSTDGRIPGTLSKYTP